MRPSPVMKTAPLPLIAPENDTASERLNSSSPLLTMFDATTAPLVPPLPTWSTPREIVMGPPLAVPVTRRMPGPDFTKPFDADSVVAIEGAMLGPT